LFVTVLYPGNILVRHSSNQSAKSALVQRNSQHAIVNLVTYRVMN
jgi:hypothetical protein